MEEYLGKILLSGMSVIGEGFQGTYMASVLGHPHPTV